MSTQEKCLENYPRGSSIKIMDTILKQMKYSVCKIMSHNKGTGFFCIIKCDNKNIPVLITNYHILNKSIIKNEKIFIFRYDEKYEESISISIDENRRMYFSEVYDICIIEIIKEKDKIYQDKIFYMELDENIFIESSKDYFRNSSIYNLSYPKAADCHASFGIIKHNGEQESLTHFCCTEEGSSGSPIVNLRNNKVIGIHTGANRLNYNEGKYLKIPIKCFEEKKYNLKYYLNDINNENVHSNMQIKNEHKIIEYYQSPQHSPKISDKFLNNNINDDNTFRKMNSNNIQRNHFKEINQDNNFSYSEKKPQKINIPKKYINKNNANSNNTYLKKNIINYSPNLNGNNSFQYGNIGYIDSSQNYDGKEIYQKYNFDSSQNFGNNCINPNYNNINYNQNNIRSDIFNIYSNNYDHQYYVNTNNNQNNINNQINNYNQNNNYYQNNNYNQNNNNNNYNHNSSESINNDNQLKNNQSIQQQQVYMNEIIIKLINKDPNKKNYFLDNIDKHGHLKELDESNVELFIEGEKKKKFKKYLEFPETKILSIKLKLKQKIKDCSYMFYGCQNIAEIDLSSFDSSNVTNMSNMFCNCSKLTKVNFSSFNTKNVTNMESMFCNCSKLTSIDLSSFETDNVLDMNQMFYGCTELIKANLSLFNTINCTAVKFMFSGCKKLKNLIIKNHDNNQQVLNEYYYNR